MYDQRYPLKIAVFPSLHGKRYKEGKVIQRKQTVWNASCTGALIIILLLRPRYVRISTRIRNTPTTSFCARLLDASSAKSPFVGDASSRKRESIIKWMKIRNHQKKTSGFINLQRIKQKINYKNGGMFLKHSLNSCRVKIKHKRLAHWRMGVNIIITNKES